MKHITLYIMFVFAAYLCPVNTFAAISLDTPRSVMRQGIDKHALNRIARKYRSIEKKLARYNEQTVIQLQKEGSFTSGEKNTFLKLKDVPTKLQGLKLLDDYLPGLDSLQMLFSFLDKNPNIIPGLSAERLTQIRSVSAGLTNLQLQLQTAGKLKQYFKEKVQLLKEQISKAGVSLQLKKINKEAYYYQQQLTEYRSLINDQGGLEKKVLGMAGEVPVIKEFIAKNNLLARLFPTPSGYGTPDVLTGLQTRSGIEQQLARYLESTSANTEQYLQQQVTQAQNELNSLKDKVSKTGGGSSDLVIPGFKPNQQKTKTFWKRIEYGLNIQLQKINSLLPVTSDIAITAGYKLNDKSTIGIGAGYKLGWGKNISNIHLSSQGISLRSYLEIKIKGSIWISGGYEENYQDEFIKPNQLNDLSAWQHSGLIGLMKKYKIGKKNSDLQVLWNFLGYKQLPESATFQFRIGYKF